MPFDFRSTQIRTNKLIGSGSTGTNAVLLVYPVAAASDLSGGITTSLFSTSSIGNDIFLYISGAINSKNTTTKGMTVFGGDALASGSFTAVGGISGSLTKLSDGTSYLVAGTLISVVSNSNGSVTISSTGNSFSFNSTSVAFSGSSGLTGSNRMLFDNNTNTLTVSGTIKAQTGLSGSLTKLWDGTSYLIAGTNISITSGSNGAVTINNTSTGVPGFNSSSVAYSGSSGITGNSGFTFNDNTRSLLVSGNITNNNGFVSLSLGDTAANTGSVVLALTHDGGAASAGIASDILFRTTNAAGTRVDVSKISSQLSTATNGSEVSRVDVQTRNSGGGLRTSFRFYGSGGIGVGTSTALIDPLDGGIVIPTSSGIYVNSGGVNHSLIGVFGGSTMSFGSGAWTVAIGAFNLSISAGQGTAIANGWLDLSCGFRRRVNATANANATATTAQSIVSITGLTADRTVTLPAVSDGNIVRVANLDGTANCARKILVTASAGATINGLTQSQVAVAQPYAFTEYLSNGTNWTEVSRNATAQTTYGTLVWEWNGRDVSQFQNTTGSFSTASFNMGSQDGIATATVLSSPLSGTFLRFSGSNSTSNGAVIWLISQFFPLYNTRGKYVLEIDVANSNTTTGTRYHGVAFAVDSGSSNIGVYGIAHYFNENESSATIQNGTHSGLSSTGGAKKTGLYRFYINMQKLVGQKLSVVSYMDGSERQRILAASGEQDSATTWIYGATPTSSWDVVTSSQMGISMFNGFGPMGFLDVRSLRIYQDFKY